MPRIHSLPRLAWILAASMLAGLALATEDLLFYQGMTYVEQQRALALGYTVRVVSSTEWFSMTPYDFAQYKAIIIPDPDCGSLSDIDFLDISKHSWTPAVSSGNIIIIGTDTTHHATQHAGANRLMDDSIRFAASGSTTGLYLSLSCYYNANPWATVSALSHIGTFKVSGRPDCYEQAHIVASAGNGTLFGPISDADLSNWDCSAHALITRYPSYGPGAFVPVAIATDAPDSHHHHHGHHFADNSSGTPYIIARGATPLGCSNGVTDHKYGEECDNGALNGLLGNACSSSCKCVFGRHGRHGACVSAPSGSSLIPSWSPTPTLNSSSVQPTMPISTPCTTFFSSHSSHHHNWTTPPYWPSSSSSGNVTSTSTSISTWTSTSFTTTTVSPTSTSVSSSHGWNSTLTSTWPTFTASSSILSSSSVSPVNSTTVSSSNLPTSTSIYTITTTSTIVSSSHGWNSTLTSTWPTYTASSSVLSSSSVFPINSTTISSSDLPTSTSIYTITTTSTIVSSSHGWNSTLTSTWPTFTASSSVPPVNSTTTSTSVSSSSSAWNSTLTSTWPTYTTSSSVFPINSTTTDISSGTITSTIYSTSTFISSASTNSTSSSSSTSTPSSFNSTTSTPWPTAPSSTFPSSSSVTTTNSLTNTTSSFQETSTSPTFPTNTSSSVTSTSSSEPINTTSSSSAPLTTFTSTSTSTLPSMTSTSTVCSSYIGIEVIIIIDVVEICPDNGETTTLTSDTETITRTVCIASLPGGVLPTNATAPTSTGTGSDSLVSPTLLAARTPMAADRILGTWTHTSTRTHHLTPPTLAPRAADAADAPGRVPRGPNEAPQTAFRAKSKTSAAVKTDMLTLSVLAVAAVMAMAVVLQ